MGNVRRDVVVSIVARAWAALLGLLAVPFYVRFLGIEAYGLVGFFTTIQTLCIFLDLGLGATLTRELARAVGDPARRPESRNVTRTFETAYLVVAVVLGLALVMASSLLAQYWIRLDSLSVGQVSRALVLGGLALAFQWPTSLYNSGMAGLHKQLQLGAASSFFATLRVLLTMAVLSVHPDLEAFFLAQLVASLIQSLALRTLLWRELALPGHQAHARMDILKSSMGFAGGMTGITITVLLLTQVDKVILSHTLPLEDFGIYVLANTLAMGLYVVISPMQSVMFPRFSTLILEGNQQSLANLYHASAQVMSLLILPAAIVVAFYSRDALFAWTGDMVLSDRGAPILALLVLGNAFNGVIAIPYSLQLAAAWASLPLQINIAALFIFTPATYVLATRYGAIGGALTWCVLNFGYILLTPQLMHRRLLKDQKIAWYLKDLAPVAVVSIAVTLVMWSLWHGQGSRLAAGFHVVFAWAAAATLSAATLPVVRRFLLDRCFR
jgi:O-antigen/teichoic acid export membrane protein